MRRGVWISWLMLAVWASWLTALQGVAVSKTMLGAWVPDVGVLLIVACAGSFQARDVSRAALVVALARIAYSVKPPVAVLAGFLGVSIVARGVLSFAEIGRPLVRTALSGALALALSDWFVLVHAARYGAELGDTAAWKAALMALPGLLPGALASAGCALLLGPAFALLPGLTPLRRPRW